MTGSIGIDVFGTVRLVVEERLVSGLTTTGTTGLTGVYVMFVGLTIVTLLDTFTVTFPWGTTTGSTTVGFSIGFSVKLDTTDPFAPSHTPTWTGGYTIGTSWDKIDTLTTGLAGYGLMMVSFLVYIYGLTMVMFIEIGAYSMGFVGVEILVVVWLVDSVVFTYFICVGSTNVGFTPGYLSVISA